MSLKDNFEEAAACGPVWDSAITVHVIIQNPLLSFYFYFYFFSTTRICTADFKPLIFLLERKRVIKMVYTLII